MSSALFTNLSLRNELWVNRESLKKAHVKVNSEFIVLVVTKPSGLPFVKTEGIEDFAFLIHIMRL